MNEVEKTYLFVYGSLQRGANHAAHEVLNKHAEFVCEAEFEGLLFLVEDYPGVVAAGDTGSRVKGELFLIQTPEPAFQQLDRYEGYNPQNPAQSLYLREKQPVHCRDTSLDTVLAWIYLYNKPTTHLKRIPSGDYLSFIKEDIGRNSRGSRT